MTLSVLRLRDTTLASLGALDAAPAGQAVETPCGLRYAVERAEGRTRLRAVGHPDNGTRQAEALSGFPSWGPWASSRGPGPLVNVEAFGGPPSWDGLYDPDWFDFITSRR